MTFVKETSFGGNHDYCKKKINMNIYIYLIYVYSFLLERLATCCVFHIKRTSFCFACQGCQGVLPGPLK